MTTVCKYRIHCIEENIDVIVHDTSPPTLCPNDHADRTIDTNLTTIISEITTNSFMAYEPTSGYFQHTTRELTIPSGTPGDTPSYDFTWPMDILLWKVEFSPGSACVGDFFNVIADPLKNAGALTTNAVISDTVLDVPASLVTNEDILPGVEVTLDDTTNTQDVGRITLIDKVNNKITVENPLSFNFNSGVTNVLINICLVKDRKIYKADDKIKLAEKGFRGKILPKNTVLRCDYKNNDGAAKALHFDLEYYYW